MPNRMIFVRHEAHWAFVVIKAGLAGTVTLAARRRRPAVAALAGVAA